MKIIATKGLPASGKSTWAKAWVTTHKDYVRINNDDLRLMLMDVQFDAKREDTISMARRTLLESFMVASRPIVVDNCNLSPRAQFELQSLAARYGYELDWKDFTHVPLSTCIERDAARDPAKRVGKRVITNMWRQFLRADPPPPEVIPGKPWAIICDLDGTLANISHRDPYATDKYHLDGLNQTIAQIVSAYYAIGDHVLFVTGREAGVASRQTSEWLQANGMWGERSALFLRREGDKRDDAIVKTEIYERDIRGNYNVRFVLDDRQRVVDAWRDIGLTCLQVAPGDF